MVRSFCILPYAKPFHLRTSMRWTVETSLGTVRPSCSIACSCSPLRASRQSDLVDSRYDLSDKVQIRFAGGEPLIMPIRNSGAEVELLVG